MVKLNKFNFAYIKKHAQDLRRNMTDSEKLLWKELRGRKLSGYKFLRQHPLLYKGNLIKYNYFIADFFCDAKKTIVELDGAVHDATEEYDTYRDLELQETGYHVLRIRNKELENMKEVLTKIELFLNKIN
jgi:very-short-patch-repair endonuclease